MTEYREEHDSQVAFKFEKDFDPEARTMVVDLDNTLFGAMQTLEQELPWYFIEGQTKYVFQECWDTPLAEIALGLFHSGDVLRKMPFIPEVEDMIAAMMKERHEQILIVSKTRPLNMDLRYTMALKNERLAPFIKGIVVWEKENPVKYLKDHVNIKSIIDDNPANLEAAKEVGLFTIKVSYIYNADFIADMSVYPQSVFTRYRTPEKEQMIQSFKESTLGTREQYDITTSDFIADLQKVCETYGFEGSIGIGVSNDGNVPDDVLTWGRGNMLYTETLNVQMTRPNRKSLSTVSQGKEI